MQSISIDDVDTDLMWKVSLPFSMWWIFSTLAAYIRLSHRHYDFSLASIRAQVAIIEINNERKKSSEASLPKRKAAIFQRSNFFSLFDSIDYGVFKVMECFGFGLSSILYCCKKNRDKREFRRTSLECGEMIIQIQPLVVMLLWGVVVLTIKGGLLFGLLLLFVGEPMTGLLWYLLAWRDTGWNYQNMQWEYRIDSIPIIAIVCLYGWLLFALATSKYSAIATGWFFFSFQMITLCWERVDRLRHHRQTFIRELFRLAQEYPRQPVKNSDPNSREGLNSSSRAAEPRANAETNVGEIESRKSSVIPHSALSFLSSMLKQIKSFCHEMKTLIQQDRHRKLQAYVILFLYVVWVAVFAPKEGKWVGLINAAVVLVVDVTISQLVYCPGLSLKPGSFVFLLLGAASRLVVASAGMSAWFIGHSIVFVLLAGFLTKLVIENRASAALSKHGQRSAAHQAPKLSTSFGSKTSFSRLHEQRSMDLIVLACFSCLYFIELICVATLKLPHIMVQGLSIAQWSVGVISVGLLIAYAAILMSRFLIQLDSVKRKFSQKKYHHHLMNGVEAPSQPNTASNTVHIHYFFSDCLFNCQSIVQSTNFSRLGILTALFLSLAAIGFLIFAVTRAYFLLSSFIFLPLICASSLSLHEQWSERNGRMFDSKNASAPHDRRNTLNPTKLSSSTIQHLSVEGIKNDDVEVSGNVSNRATPNEATVAMTMDIQTNEASDKATDPSHSLKATACCSSTRSCFSYCDTGVPLCKYDSRNKVSSTIGLCFKNWREGDFKKVTFLVAMLRCGLSVYDSITLFTIGSLLLFLALYSYVASLGGWPYAWCLSVFLLELMSIYCIKEVWDHTFNLKSVLPFVVLSMVCHICLHAGLLSQGNPFDGDSENRAASNTNSVSSTKSKTDDENENRLSGWGALVLFSFIGIPAVCAIIYGFKQLLKPKLLDIASGAKRNTNIAAFGGSGEKQSEEVREANTSSGNASSGCKLSFTVGYQWCEMKLKKWKVYLSRNGVTVSAFLPIMFGVCILIICALIIASLYSRFVGGSLILFIALCLFSSFIFWRWCANRYYLPTSLKYLVLGFFLLVIASSCIMGVLSSGFTAFMLLSLSLFAAAIGLILAFIADTVASLDREEISTFPVVSSSRADVACFPLMRYSAMTNGNRGGKFQVIEGPILCLCLGLLLLVVWSLFAASLLDHVALGLCFFNSIVLLCVFCLVANVTRPTNQIIKAWEVLSLDHFQKFSTFKASDEEERKEENKPMFVAATRDFWLLDHCLHTDLIKKNWSHLREARSMAIQSTLPSNALHLMVSSSDSASVTGGDRDEGNLLSKNEWNLESNSVEKEIQSKGLRNSETDEKAEQCFIDFLYSFDDGANLENDENRESLEFDESLWSMNLSLLLLKHAQSLIVIKEFKELATCSFSPYRMLCACCSQLMVILKCRPRKEKVVQPDLTGAVILEANNETVTNDGGDEQAQASSGITVGNPTSDTGTNKTFKYEEFDFNSGGNDPIYAPASEAIDIEQLIEKVIQRSLEHYQFFNHCQSYKQSSSSSQSMFLNNDEDSKLAKLKKAQRCLKEVGVLRIISQDEQMGMDNKNNRKQLERVLLPVRTGQDLEESTTMVKFNSWSSVSLLNQRRRMVSLKTALLYAHFHTLLVQSGERVMQENESKFQAFLTWLSNRVSDGVMKEEELGDLGSVLLGEVIHDSILNEKNKQNDSEARCNVGENGEREDKEKAQRNLDSGDEMLNEKSVQQHPNVKRQLPDLTFSDVLEWSDRYQKQVAKLITMYSKEKIIEKEELEKKLKEDEEKAKKREQDKVREEERKRKEAHSALTEEFEVPSSLPDNFRQPSSGIEWTSAAEMGMLQLAKTSSPDARDENRFDCNDVIQGQIGNCWFISAMSLVASHPHLMERIFMDNPQLYDGGENANGSSNYKIRLYKQGGWIAVDINDKLPAVERARGGKRVPIFVSSKYNDEAWPCLLEKGYAKYYGGYHNLDGGFVHLGLVDLTGGVGEHIRVKENNGNEVWAQLLKLHNNGDLIGAGSNSGRDSDLSPQGIAQGHAYSVLQVIKIGSLKLIKLRNPWGQSGWIGPYSDSDPGHLWTEKLKAATKYNPDKNDGNSNGVFWMELIDFLREFNSLYICRLFNLAEAGGKWHKLSISGAWSQSLGSAGGYRNAATEPQIKFTVSNPAEVYATLTLDYTANTTNNGEEEVERGSETSPQIGLWLLKAPKENDPSSFTPLKHSINNSRAFHEVSNTFTPVQYLAMNDIIAGPESFTNLPTVSLSVPRLEPSEDGYILLATTHQANMCSQFTVTIYVDYPFSRA